MTPKRNQWFSKTVARGKVKQWIRTAGGGADWEGGAREVLRGAERRLHGYPLKDVAGIPAVPGTTSDQIPGREPQNVSHSRSSDITNDLLLTSRSSDITNDLLLTSQTKAPNLGHSQLQELLVLPSAIGDDGISLWR